MKLDTIFASFGLTNSTGELIVIALVLLIVSVIFWVSIGRFSLHNFLINIYVSFALLHVIPLKYLSFTENGSALVFLISVIVLTLMNRYLFDIHVSGSGMVMWQVFVMSFLEVGLTASILLSLISTKDIHTYISETSLVYFVDPWARLIWMILPLGFLVFVNKRQ